MKINEYIRFMRRKNNLTTHQLAELVGVSRATISKWENKTIRRISTEHAQKLSEVLGIDVDALLAEQEMERKEETPIKSDDEVRKMAVRIKERRVYNGLTQAELAEKLGVTKYTIGKWECRKVRNIPARYIEKMSRLFGVRTTYLYGIDDEPDDVESFFSLMVMRPEIKYLLELSRHASKGQIEAICRLLIDLNGTGQRQKQENEGGEDR